MGLKLTFDIKRHFLSIFEVGIMQQLLVETVDVFGTLPLSITLLCSLGTGRRAGGFILISI